MGYRRFLSHVSTAVILCLFSLACTAISTRKTDKNNVATATNYGPNIVYGDLIIPSNSEYMLIPVGFPVEADKYRGKADMSTNFSLGSDSARFNNLLAYNILFNNKKDAKTHLLLSKNTLISSFQFINDETEKGQPKNKFLFFELMPEDTNGDGSINYQDARVGYLADNSGRKIKQITPNKTKIISWHLDKKQGFMLLKVIKDSDDDKEFTEKDDIAFLRVSLNAPSIGSDIISEPIRQQINQRMTP